MNTAVNLRSPESAGIICSRFEAWRGGGRAWVGAGDKRISIHDAQSPVLGLRERDGPLAPKAESLGLDRTGIAEKGAPEGLMPGTSALARTALEQSRGFIFSPHPERTDGAGVIVGRAVTWLATRNVPAEPQAAATQPELSAWAFCVERELAGPASPTGVRRLLGGSHPPKRGYSRAAKHANLASVAGVPFSVATVSRQPLQPFKP